MGLYDLNPWKALGCSVAAFFGLGLLVTIALRVGADALVLPLAFLVIPIVFAGHWALGRGIRNIKIKMDEQARLEQNKKWRKREGKW